jgi:hypothetical protein
MMAHGFSKIQRKNNEGFAPRSKFKEENSKTKFAL